MATLNRNASVMKSRNLWTFKWQITKKIDFSVANEILWVKACISCAFSRRISSRVWLFFHITKSALYDLKSIWLTVPASHPHFSCAVGRNGRAWLIAYEKPCVKRCQKCFFNFAFITFFLLQALQRKLIDIHAFNYVLSFKNVTHSYSLSFH